MSNAGWQSPAVPPRCTHMGLILAALTITQHPPGHVWRCTCGQRWVVVLVGEERKLRRVE